jgi:DNA-binding CsgD family transcriptional regulator
MAVTQDPGVRAQIALALGRARASFGDFRAAAEVLAGALRGLEDTDGELGVALEAELLAMSSHEFTSTGLGAPYWERRLSQLDAGEELDPSTMACLVMAIAVSRGPASAAIRLADRVLDSAWSDQPNSVVAGLLGNGLIYAGAPSRGARFYDETIGAATRRGSRLTVAWQLVMRSDASLRLGEIRCAEAEARSALELFEEGSGESAFAWGTAHLLNALVARGALDEADELLTRGMVGASPPPTLPVGLLLTARANLHLAQGRPAEALMDAYAAGNLMSATISNPGCCGWRSSAALALAALDRGAEALVMVEGELADARRFGIRDAEGTALRTLGLVTGGTEGLKALRDSVAALELAEGRLEHARSVLELGAALRRAGERAEARDVLREALDATARLGASGLADRAHEELVAAGARPRRDRRLLSGRESLTASEDRVAALAAEGLTNREIAQRLFVSVKAVQWHLRNVYRKLGIRSRAELTAKLDAEDAEPALSGAR